MAKRIALIFLIKACESVFLELVGNDISVTGTCFEILGLDISSSEINRRTIFSRMLENENCTDRLRQYGT